MATKVTEGQRNQATLTLDTLGDLADGQARATIDAALNAAVRDTEDRGDDKAKRTVTITVDMKKLGDGVVTAVKAKTGIPAYQTKETYGRLRVNGGKAEVVFNPACAENPDQKTIDDIDAE